MGRAPGGELPRLATIPLRTGTHTGYAAEPARSVPTGKAPDPDVPGKPGTKPCSTMTEDVSAVVDLCKTVVEMHQKQLADAEQLMPTPLEEFKLDGVIYKLLPDLRFKRFKGEDRCSTVYTYEHHSDACVLRVRRCAVCRRTVPYKKGTFHAQTRSHTAAARAKSADVCVKKYVRKWGDLPQSLMWIFLRLPTLW